MANDQGLRLQVYIPGKNRVVSAEVMLKYIAKALGSGVFEQGTHEIYQDNDGRVFVNGQLIHTPKGVPEL